jgi:hypothetical protein
VTSTFAVYLELGFDHIADLAGYDHILFIVALAAGYGLAQWRHLLVLVTAFTVGHTVTLALATLRLVSVSPAWIEFLIPLTIVVTGGYSLWETRERGADLVTGVARDEMSGRGQEAPGGRHEPGSAGRNTAARRTRLAKYAMALFFGLIHGLGFSSYLRALLGEEESILMPLFSFNVGLEVGQFAILVCVLLVTSAVTGFSLLRPRAWTRILSLGAVGPAFALLVSRLPF